MDDDRNQHCSDNDPIHVNYRKLRCAVCLSEFEEIADRPPYVVDALIREHYETYHHCPDTRCCCHAADSECRGSPCCTNSARLWFKRYCDQHLLRKLTGGDGEMKCLICSQKVHPDGYQDHFIQDHRHTGSSTCWCGCSDNCYRGFADLFYDGSLKIILVCYAPNRCDYQIVNPDSDNLTRKGS